MNALRTRNEICLVAYKKLLDVNDITQLWKYDYVHSRSGVKWMACDDYTRWEATVVNSNTHTASITMLPNVFFYLYLMMPFLHCHLSQDLVNMKKVRKMYCVVFNNVCIYSQQFCMSFSLQSLLSPYLQGPVI